MGGACLLLLKTSALWGYRETTAAQARFWQIKACQNHTELPVGLDLLILSLYGSELISTIPLWTYNT